MAGAKPIYQLWNDEEFYGDPQVRTMAAMPRWMYRSLLQAAFWTSTRPYLPCDDEPLWRLAGCDNKEQWMEHREVVLGMFTRDGDRLYRNRLIRDWKKVTDFRKKQRKNGKLGGRRLQPNAPPDETTANPTVSQTQANISKGKGSKGEVRKENVSPGADAAGEEVHVAKLSEEIADLCRTILKVTPPHPRSDSWAEFKPLVRVYGKQQVADAFKGWAEANAGSGISYPVSAFVKVADAMLSGTLVMQTSESSSLAADLAQIAGGDVAFNPAQKGVLARLLKDYTVDEIKSAFRNFYGRVSGDEFQLKFAARDFVDQADQLCIVVRREAEQRARDIEGAERGHAERLKRDQAMRDAKRAKEADEPIVDDDEWDVPSA